MGVLDEYINGSDSDAVSFTIANKSDPVDWSELAEALGGSLAIGTASGIAAIPQGYAEGIETTWGGADEGIEKIIDGVYSPFIGFVNSAWDVAFIEQLGFLAGPAAIGITLAALWAFFQGLRLAVAAAKGGGRL